MLGLERGSFGYIKKKKMRHTGMILLLILIGLVILISGILIYKKKQNIFTVMALLMILPAARHLVTVIIMFPYRSVSKERYNKIVELAGDNAVVMTDMVITSPEKVMNLDFVVITDNQLLGLVGKEGQDVKYIENYLKDSLKNNKLEEFTVKVFEDEKQYVKCIPARDYESTELQKECFMYVRTLVV